MRYITRFTKDSDDLLVYDNEFVLSQCTNEHHFVIISPTSLSYYIKNMICKHTKDIRDTNERLRKIREIVSTEYRNDFIKICNTFMKVACIIKFKHQIPIYMDSELEALSDYFKYDKFTYFMFYTRAISNFDKFDRSTHIYELVRLPIVKKFLKKWIQQFRARSILLEFFLRPGNLLANHYSRHFKQIQYN